MMDVYLKEMARRVYHKGNLQVALAEGKKIFLNVFQMVRICMQKTRNNSCMMCRKVSRSKNYDKQVTGKALNEVARKDMLRLWSMDQNT